MIARKNILITIDDVIYGAFKYIIDKEGCTISKVIRNHITQKVIDNTSMLAKQLGIEYIDEVEGALKIRRINAEPGKVAASDVVVADLDDLV